MNKIIKITFIFSVFFYTPCVNANDLNTKFNSIERSSFGIKATHDELDDLEKFLPEIPLSKTGKSFLTVNKTGFDVLNSESQQNWVLNEYCNFLKANTPQRILDIGAGYGRISHIGLKHDKILIANDIAIEHLMHTRKKAKLNGLNIENLYLNNSYFPNDIAIENETLDAVVLYRVIHFLSPDEIELGLAKIYKGLKKGGKVFIVVLSPQHKEYSDWFLPIYNAKWNAGDKWPGVNLDVSKALPKQEYNLPKHLHVMDERPLAYALEKQGFLIAKYGFVDMRRFNSSKGKHKRDGRGSFGIIAVKN